MDFQRIETAYDLVLTNVQALQTQLATHFFDALVEQNALYLGADTSSEALSLNNQRLADMALSPEEWRRVFQFLLIKGAQEDKLQANHQFTPDAIGFVLMFLMETLTDKAQLDVLEIGSGTGNLAFTLLNNSSKQLDYLGLEVDDLLIDLSASMADVMGADISLVQEDAVRPQLLKESDVILSDLPVGYYPNDEVASRYQVASPTEHTYAHHLLMEQSLKYLKTGGVAIFLAPTDLLTSPQSSLLKQWLSDYASLLAVVTLPDKLFGSQAASKSIFVLRKQAEPVAETFAYPLTDLQDKETLLAFTQAVQKWKKSV